MAEKRNAWREAVEQCANMMAMDPYPGFEGEFFSMPARNVVPKPVQKPHPPLWVACSNRETIKLAARLGIGALTFAFVDPAEAKQWVDDYYRIFKEECVPIGHAVNPNICMVSSFGVHQDAEVARQRFQDGFRFFQFALGWHYGFGEQIPGRTNIWELFQKAQAHAGRLRRRGRHRRRGRGRHRHAGRAARRTCASSTTAASTRSPSSSRAAATSTSTSARRSSCSPAR